MEMCMAFSVDHNSIEKSDILNIHEYLMTNNKNKQCLACLLHC